MAAVAAGEDTEGNEYTDVGDLWSQECNGENGRASWYKKATDHWLEQDASINGVLGGFPETNGPDLRESGRFLDLLFQSPAGPGKATALDLGAGIGRVSESVLVSRFERVDLVEPCAKLLETARSTLKGTTAHSFVLSSLQDFTPEDSFYDVIWAQWVLLYLPDDDLVDFLRRCQGGLRENGIIGVKENVVLKGNWVHDTEDNSIMRTEAQYKAIFKRAGLVLAHELLQANWPQELFPVKMYALKPIGAVKKRPAKAD